MHEPILIDDPHTLRMRFAAGEIDLKAGIIPGATVGKAGVQAKGKVIWLDSKGMITSDPKRTVKKLPVFTDQKFLNTLMGAVQDAGGKLKVREDHDDTIGARAGYASAFRMDGDRVQADIHIFDSFRNRAVVMETATKTPDKIGLSIDFEPEFEILEDRALLRVISITAVDIVDEGAITPEGLLLSARVDRQPNGETNSETLSVTPMANPTTPSTEEIMSAISALSKNVEGCMAAIAKLATPAEEKEELAAVKKQNEQLSASLSKVTEGLEQLRAEQLRAKRERQLLGFRGSDTERAALANKSDEDIARALDTQKSYLQLKAEAQAAGKLSAAAAHAAVVKTEDGKRAYALHLSSKGISHQAA